MTDEYNLGFFNNIIHNIRVNEVWVKLTLQRRREYERSNQIILENR